MGDTNDNFPGHSLQSTLESGRLWAPLADPESPLSSLPSPTCPFLPLTSGRAPPVTHWLEASPSLALGPHLLSCAGLERPSHSGGTVQGPGIFGKRPCLAATPREPALSGLGCGLSVCKFKSRQRAFAVGSPWARF